MKSKRSNHCGPGERIRASSSALSIFDLIRLNKCFGLYAEFVPLNKLRNFFVVFDLYMHSQGFDFRKEATSRSVVHRIEL